MISWIWEHLAEFLANNTELLACQQSIDELRDKLDVCRSRLQYYRLILVGVALWAVLATLVAIELALH